MHLDLADDVSCRCGHEPSAHRHHRGGTDCALCLDCPRFRRARGGPSGLALSSLNLIAAALNQAGAWLRDVVASLRGARPQP
jgi:hypothetical protein